MEVIDISNESRDLKMEDTLPSIQIGLMGILAVYGFVTLFFRLTGASSRSGGDDLFNIFKLRGRSQTTFTRGGG